MNDQFDELLSIVRDEMDDNSAETQIERRVDFIIRELDEFCRLATNRETADLIEGQSFGLGQVQTRVQLLLSFVAARKPTQFRIVRNA